MTDCLFCDVVRTGADAANRIAEFEHSVAVVHFQQAFRGRCILVLKPHYLDVLEVPDAVHAALNDDLRRLGRAVRDAYRPDRINYSNFGNVEPHVHWQLIPRYRDDGHWGGPIPMPETKLPMLPDTEYRAIAERIRAEL
ncbi:HIT family protein [Thalassobaculum sp.]|uniref:HIT family protein n=1 Tax=Thalassobaculum sp. TaxID=2022740 RepID=UPI003B59533F